MNKLLNATKLILICFLLAACSSAPIDTTVKAPQGQYKAELAKQLGADDYGMRSYVFATLLTGPNDATITDEKERAELFKGHFSNMGRLAEEGKLILAGPFMEGAPKRGLFILKVVTIEEAEALVQTDPSIAAGIFKVEFTKFYGSAALMQVNEIHQQIQKVSVN